MRSHMIQQYKKIKNSPMRSPSPDYSCRNRSKTSHMPLEESHILCNSKMNKNTAVQFPIIPMQVLRKKNSCEIENIRPQKRGQEKQNQGSTALPKKQKITLPSAQISIFSVSPEKLHKDQKQQLDYIFKLIEQIYKQVFTYIQQDQKQANQLSEIIRKLEAIKEKVNEQVSKSLQSGCKKIDQQCSFAVHECDKNSRIFQQIKGELESSPIKNRDNHEEDSLSIFQIHQILSENNKLRKQLTALKLQIEGSHEKKQPDSKAKEMELNDWYQNQHKKSVEQLNKQGIIWQGAQNDSSFSSTTVQFLKQKITFLQNQLENQFEKWSQMQSQKEMQISTLKRRIAEISDYHQRQNEKYRSIIDQQKKVQANKNMNFKEIPKRSRINSQTIKRQQSQIKKINQQPQRVIIQARKALSWDKQQVVSICDQSQHQEESQYSQAERIDVQNMFATRRQTSKKEKEREKAHYEQIIANNTIKYHQQLQILQQQLLQLRQYLEQQDLDSDVEHKKCANCCNIPQIMQLQREINLLKNQIIQEKNQNGKLREIISKAIEKGEAKVQNRTRGRKLQKLTKRSIKSDNQSEIQASQIIDDVNMSLSLQTPSNKLKNSGV